MRSCVLVLLFVTFLQADPHPVLAAPSNAARLPHILIDRKQLTTPV